MLKSFTVTAMRFSSKNDNDIEDLLSISQDLWKNVGSKTFPLTFFFELRFPCIKDSYSLLTDQSLSIMKLSVGLFRRL